MSLYLVSICWPWNWRRSKMSLELLAWVFRVWKLSACVGAPSGCSSCHAELPVGVNVIVCACLFLYDSPVMTCPWCQPGHFNDSWNRLQPPNYPWSMNDETRRGKTLRFKLSPGVGWICRTPGFYTALGQRVQHLISLLDQRLDLVVWQEVRNKQRKHFQDRVTFLWV